MKSDYCADPLRNTVAICDRVERFLCMKWWTLVAAV